VPETKAQRSAAARKGAATRKRNSANTKEREESGAVDRTAKLSDEVLTSLESGQRAAIEAVTRFVDTIDHMLPGVGERPSRRQDVVDAAMEMADRLVHTQYDFLRKVVQSTGKTLSKPDDGK
jgi:hypothetical protein